MYQVEGTTQQANLEIKKEKLITLFDYLTLRTFDNNVFFKLRPLYLWR